MKDRLHFSMAITECNPNTFNGTCEDDIRALRREYQDLLIQLNIVSESFDINKDVKKVDQFGFMVAPSMQLIQGGSLAIRKNIVSEVSDYFLSSKPREFFNFDGYAPWSVFSSKVNEEGVKEFANIQVSFSDQMTVHHIQTSGVFTLLA